jgi:hypothetical protein
MSGYLRMVGASYVFRPAKCRQKHAKTCEQTMNASRPIPGAPMRRIRLLPKGGPDELEPDDARRLRRALVCMFAGYAVAWVEIPMQLALSPSDANVDASSLAAAVVARVLLGVLYLLVAFHCAWARWTVVALGFLSAFFVTPMLPSEWEVFPLAALVTALGVVCKLVAAILLMLPLRPRRSVP